MNSNDPALIEHATNIASGAALILAWATIGAIVFCGLALAARWVAERVGR